MEDKSEDLDPADIVYMDGEEMELLLRDVQRGLADIEAGRVVPHEEVIALLLTRYK